MKIVRFLLATFLATFTLATPLAAAFDAPLLTWERGRTQQVVLGGGDYTSGWIVRFEGGSQEPIDFTRSEPNEAGYVVYSVDIPDSYEPGSYSVATYGEGSPRTLVAGITLIPGQSITPVDSLYDLTLIVFFFVLLTVAVSALRTRKYTNLQYPLTQPLRLDEDAIAPVGGRFSMAVISRVRANNLSDLRPSVFKFLLISEGELLYRLSPKIYSLAPFIGLLIGVLAGFETVRNGGLLETSAAIFLVIFLLAAIDPYSGIFALLSFGVVEVVAGELSSVRDLLILMAMAFSLVGSVLLAALLKHGAAFDYPSSRNPRSGLSLIVRSLISALFGVAMYYFGNLLANSIWYSEAPNRQVAPVHLAIVFAALLLRSFIFAAKIKSDEEQHLNQEEFTIARLNSPTTAAIIHLVIFAFNYIWTEDALRALMVSTLFALSYYLIFINFESNAPDFFLRLPRNVTVESLTVAALALLAFTQVANRPLLSDELSFWFLIISIIPVIIHALLCAIWTTPADKEILKV
jgi:hypothetical protein